MIYRALFLSLVLIGIGLTIRPLSARSQNSAPTVRKKITQSRSPRNHAPTDTVGVVNGVVIAYGDFKSIMSGYLRTFVERSHNDLVTDSLYSVIVDSAWIRAVTDVLIEQEIHKRKLAMSDTAIKSALLDNPPDYLRAQFTDSLGVLRKDVLKRALADPASDSIVEMIVGAEKIRLETDRLIQTVAAKAHTPAERIRLFDLWLRKAMATSKIVDRRTAFGYY